MKTVWVDYIEKGTRGMGIGSEKEVKQWEESWGILAERAPKWKRKPSYLGETSVVRAALLLDSILTYGLRHNLCSFFFIFCVRVYCFWRIKGLFFYRIDRRFLDDIPSSERSYQLIATSFNIVSSSFHRTHSILRFNISIWPSLPE